MKDRLGFTSIIEVDIELFLVRYFHLPLWAAFNLICKVSTSLYFCNAIFSYSPSEADLCSAIFIHVVTMVTPAS